MTETVILSAVRTPIGKYLGGLADVPAVQLGATAIAEALRRAGVPTERIDEVIMGNVIQAGPGQSPHRAAAAWERGAFNAEIVPVTVGSGAKARTVTRDEGIRPDSTAETLAKLKPSFRSEGGTVTAGNASMLSDGAAVVVVASARA